jgi:hypothetical protein
MSALLNLQWEFSQSLARLLQQAAALGYHVQMGECYRTLEQAALNAAAGTGVANSAHTLHLAVDLNLFTPEGAYITGIQGHEELGAFWKELGANYRWGGDFARRDFNHYSITPDGGVTA